MAANRSLFNQAHRGQAFSRYPSEFLLAETTQA
jgi:hypothetical protein